VTVAHERRGPIWSILPGDTYLFYRRTTPCARQKPNPARSKCDDSSPFFSLRPAPVSSPHRWRHVNSSSVWNVFLGLSWPFFQNRPARQSPPTSLSPFQLQASPIHASLFFSSVHLLPCSTRHFPLRLPSISPVRLLGLSSAPGQLSSARLALAHRQHVLVVVGGTARQDMTGQERFIHSRLATCLVRSPRVHSTVACAHAHK
jgi:hypothetical protein